MAMWALVACFAHAPAQETRPADAPKDENPAAEKADTPASEDDIYEATDVDDAVNYVISAALDCEPKICIRLPQKAGATEAKKIINELGEYRLARNYSYMSIKEGKRIRLEIKPKYSSCVRMIHSLHNPGVIKLTPKEQEALDKARSVLNSLNLTSLDNTGKAQRIHDWIVQNCSYDMAGLRKGFSSYKKGEEYNPYDGKYMILENKGVCDSYAQAYWLMLQMVGVPSCMIMGTAKGAKHAWNLVYMDDHWAHVDVTWDDPYSTKGEFMRNTYFDKTNKEMSKTHRWKKDHLSAEHKVLEYKTVKEFIAFLKKERKKAASYTVIIEEAKDCEKLTALATEEAEKAGLRVRLVAKADVFFPGAQRVRLLKPIANRK